MPDDFKEKSVTPESLAEVSRLLKAIYPVHMRIEEKEPSDEEFRQLWEHLENVVELLEKMERGILKSCLDGSDKQKENTENFYDHLLLTAKALMIFDQGYLSKTAITVASFVMNRGGDCGAALDVFEKYALSADSVLKELESHAENADGDAKDAAYSECWEFKVFIADQTLNAVCMIPPECPAADDFYEMAVGYLEYIAGEDLQTYHNMIMENTHLWRLPAEFPGGATILRESYKRTKLDPDDMTAHLTKLPVAVIRNDNDQEWPEKAGYAFRDALDIVRLAADVIVNFPDMDDMVDQAEMSLRRYVGIMQMLSPRSAAYEVGSLGLSYTKYPDAHIFEYGIKSLFALIQEIQPEGCIPTPCGDKARANVANLKGWHPARDTLAN